MQRARAALTNLKMDPATLPAFYEAVCRDMVEHIGSTRASVWTFSTLKDAITSESLYDSRDGSVTGGTTLKEEDFGEYFRAINTDLKIVAADALTHPATICFDEIYFTPLDIRSLLDHVVMVRDEPRMVLCCEHCGEQKTWTDADMDYLHQMSAVVGMALRLVQR